MRDLTNCPKCGTLFVKALRPICNPCFKVQEECFMKVKTYMNKKENRMATVQEVHEYTSVSYEMIHQFIREGRLVTTQFPNLGYPCESCGDSINEGRICSDCRSQITKGLDQIEREEQLKQKLKEEEKSAYQTYRSMEIERD
ncbi:TIGR03826 family flagellar region protein [Alkalihalobacillus sp. 1P02AB]|uniref:TIGR03826 family flagellar region protein n=1 Tax=Alkalihalobacillus sp. 1P02AB TaxID=3132260 RepID=UPI0039A68082